MTSSDQLVDASAYMRTVDFAKAGIPHLRIRSRTHSHLCIQLSVEMLSFEFFRGCLCAITDPTTFCVL